MKQLFVLFACYLLSVSTTLASPNFEDTYGIPADASYSDLADQVVSSRFDDSSITLAQKQKRLDNLQLRIESKIKQFPDDPLIWFLSGLNQNTLAEVQYLIISEKDGQQQAATDIDVSNFNIARSRAYDNAIRLDSSQPHRLSSTIYATMGYGLSNRQKIKTYSRELELGSPAENESNEWFMHWAKIDALVHEKKLEEAEQALTELKLLLQQKNRTDSAYSTILEQAETQVKAVQNTVEKRTEASSSQSTSQSSQNLPGDSSWGWEAWLVTGFGIFTFIFVLIAAIYLRKR